MAGLADFSLFNQQAEADPTGHIGNEFFN